MRRNSDPDNFQPAQENPNPATKEIIIKRPIEETNIENHVNQVQQNLLTWNKEASSLNYSLPTFTPIFNDNDKSEVNRPSFEDREQAKDDFMRLSRDIYPDPINTNLLEEFEKDYNEYNKEKTLRWYTRGSFLEKVTKNSLRIATSDSIQSCRLFLNDMEQAIKDQYQEKSKDFNGLLYRGAYLSDNEWVSLKENLNKKIEMHGFLSALKDKEVALKFMNTDLGKKVLITILVPKGPNDEEQGFAEIQEFSNEKEVLFNVRSRFTVLETEDDYADSEITQCRHLVLLYGAQGFRKFMTEENPSQEVLIPSMESGFSCAPCNAKNERLFFISIEKQTCYCRKCIDSEVGPFLIIPAVNTTRKSTTAKIQGCSLKMYSSQEQTPFYGYKCDDCQAQKQKPYFICTDCSGKKWCEDCFDSKTPDCLKAEHNIILETSPFSFWYEKTHESVNMNTIRTLDPATEPIIEKEIIVKCSIEEMMKAFFKDYVIVWHDPNAANQENQQYILQLKKFCEVLTFTEWEKAKDYIQSTQAVCHVISSGINGELLVEEIIESDNVGNIYIFCENKEYHSSWAKDFAKVSCIEKNIQNLINQIQQNLLEWYKKASSLNLNLPAFAPIFNDSDKSEMNSLHLYLKVIPNFKNRKQAKEDFMALSSRIYSDPINADLLGEFEKEYNEYNKEKTLRWYTKESFLYKVTNNCLRIATSDSIQYSRLLLRDMEQAIKDQYQEKSKDFNGLLYRGAYLSDNEWLSLKENLDKEVEMHGFLSVSKKKNIAVNFVDTDPSKKVFITIMVPKGSNDEEQGFAEMEKYSHFPGEREILFNVRSRFTVLETEDDYEYAENATCRHLVLLYGAQGFRKYITEQNPYYEVSIPSKESLSCAYCNAKNEKLFFVSISEDHYYCKACIDYGETPFLCVPLDRTPFSTDIEGCLLMMNTSQEKTQFYGYKCYNCQAKKQKSYFICTECSGKKWCENCFDSKTPDCLKVGHNIILETSPFSFWCERMSANELTHLEYQENLVAKDNEVFLNAEMYFESHEYEKAIEYYSLYIQENEAKGKDTNLAMSYNNIGLAYDSKGEYKKALENYLKSLDIQKSVYGGDNHPSVATCYNNIGSAYDNQGEYPKALEYYWKSLGIRKSIYEGDNHPSVATSYNNIGLAYKKQGEQKKALECLLKCVDIKKSLYEENNHPGIATSYNNIGGIYDDQGEYRKALEYYLKSLEIKKSVYGDNHPSVATSFNNIGLVYNNIGLVDNNQEEYPKALEYLLKGLNIRKSVYGAENHPDIAASYNNIGLVYKNQGEHKKAIEYFLKSLDIRKSVYGGENHPLVATSFNNIGLVYDNQGEHEKALQSYFKSLDIRKNFYKGENHSSVAASYNNIGQVCKSQGEYKKALEYLFKSLDIRKSLYGGDHHQSVANSFSNIGVVYENQGEYEKALECYLKCLDIQKSVYGDQHPSTIKTQSRILNIQSVYLNKPERDVLGVFKLY